MLEFSLLFHGDLYWLYVFILFQIIPLLYFFFGFVYGSVNSKSFPIVILFLHHIGS